MVTVRQLIEAKQGALVTVTPDTTVRHALELMATADVGAVLVLDRNELIGVMSERDYARKVVLRGKASDETVVSEIMTNRLVCAGLDMTVPECMTLMSTNRIRHLPVVEGERLLGVISMGDLVNATISEQAYIIRQLETYIAS